MKKNMCFWVVAAMMASCTNSELPVNEETSGQVEIKMSTGIQADGNITRTPLEGATFAADNALPAKVMMTGTAGKYTMNDDAKKLFYDGKMTFKGADLTSFAPAKQYYPANGDAVYFCGLFPSTDPDTWTVESDGASASYTFDGKTDVMVAKQITGSKTNKDNKALEFKHVLTKLIVKAQAENDADMTEIVKKWGNITGIELKTTPNNKVKVDLVNGTADPTAAGIFSGGTATVFYGASGTATPYTYTDDTFASIAIPAFSATPDVIAYSLTAPFVYSDATLDLTFDITTEKGGKIAGVVAKLSKASTETNTQGLYCIVTFTFKLSEVQATATIKDWEPGGTADGTVQ